jgi:hypothetical protein
MAEHTVEPLGAAWLEHTATREQLQFFEDEGPTPWFISARTLRAHHVSQLFTAAQKSIDRPIDRGHEARTD